MIDTPAATSLQLIGDRDDLRVPRARGEVILAVQENIQRATLDEPKLRPQRLDRTAHPLGNAPYRGSVARRPFPLNVR
jgi:hypothetical protein